MVAAFRASEFNWRETCSKKTGARHEAR